MQITEVKFKIILKKWSNCQKIIEFIRENGRVFLNMNNLFYKEWESNSSEKSIGVTVGNKLNIGHEHHSTLQKTDL